MNYVKWTPHDGRDMRLYFSHDDEEGLADALARARRDAAAHPGPAGSSPSDGGPGTARPLDPGGSGEYRQTRRNMEQALAAAVAALTSEVLP